jgi:oligosaccharide repeat unit polymerase
VSAGKGERSKMKVPWWFNPAWIALFWISLVWLGYLIPAHSFASIVKAPKFIDLEFSMMYSLMLSAFIAGSIVFSLDTRRKHGEPLSDSKVMMVNGRLQLALSPGRVVVWSIVFGTLSFLAYVIWLGPAVNADVFALILSGADRQVIATYANQISGVTTATQFGVAVAYVSALCLMSDLGRRKHRLIFWLFLILFICLSVARALMWSERLALIEIIAPVALLWLAVHNHNSLLVRLAPFLGVIAAIVVFSIFEFFRSWQFYSVSELSFVGFAVERFVAYYLSSVNNFAMLQESISPSWLPLNSAGFFFLFPGMENLNEIKDNRETQYYFIELFRNTTPEFNLFSAAGYFWDDFGWLGGSIVALLFGAVSGRLYYLFRSGALFGLLLFPFWMVGLIDLGRLLYWTSGRAFPSFVALLVAYWLLRPKGGRLSHP